MNYDLSKIIDQLKEKNFAKAELELNDLKQKFPEDFNINKVLGICLLSQKKYNQALTTFNYCYELKDDDYDVNVNLAFLFLKVQDYKMTIKFSKQAINVNPSLPSPYHNLAECYLYLHNFEEAESNVLLSIKYRGGHLSQEALGYPDLLNLYADILMAQNKISEFKDFAIEVLDTGVYHSELFMKLLKNNRSDIKDKYLDVLFKITNEKTSFETLIMNNTYKSAANFCLAAYFSKIDQKKSEEIYIIANKYISEMQRQSLFQRQKKYSKLIKIFQDYNSESTLSKIDPNKGKGLIFIIGMPRSGTTLTESIIATSPDAIAGGERVYFNIQLNPLIKEIENGEKILDFDFFNDLGDRYLEIISIHRKEKKFFIDKLPENFLFYKFIKLALPASKFIHVHRDPWDNAISLFKENYAENVYFASSFFGIALEYANYENIISFWKGIDGQNCFLDIRYERLVSETEDVVQEIWDYIGLTGKYSSSKRKEHFANTASRQQVTQGIFKSSLKKTDFIKFKDTFVSDLENQRLFWKKKLISKLN
jgi:tetratricopeptide (TPR) repeat protein